MKVNPQYRDQLELDLIIYDSTWSFLKFIKHFSYDDGTENYPSYRYKNIIVTRLTMDELTRSVDHDSTMILDLNVRYLL